MRGMDIRLVSSDDRLKNEWNQMIVEAPGGTLFHKTFWCDAWEGKVAIWGIMKGNELLGGFVAPHRNLLFGKGVYTPPFTPYGGVVFRNYRGKYVSKVSYEKELSRELAIHLKHTYRWGIACLHSSVLDVQPFIWTGFKIGVTYTYIVNIEHLNVTRNEMMANARNHLRKAEKDGLSVVATDDLYDVLALVRKTYERRKITFPTKAAQRYHEELCKRNLCKGFVCLDKQGRKIAALLIVWDEKRAYGLLSGYDHTHRHESAGLLCQWKAFEFAHHLGVKQFDLEGSMIPGVERFYRAFGGELTPHFQIIWGLAMESIAKVRKMIYRWCRV
jgi:hypothetical protein